MKLLRMKLLFISCWLIIFNACTEPAGRFCEWPCFHGPDRTNKSPETGLLKEWPEEGPELLWTASGMAEGYSTVSVSEGYIYTAGTIGGQTYVIAFDLNGKMVWQKPNGKAWSTMASHARSYTGARSTPTIDNGVLYHLGETGRLAAFDSKTGEELWYRELMEDFEANETEYGYSESVFIDENNLNIRPAGQKGYQVCLEKNTGELIWANSEIPGVEGYTSPVIMEYAGYRQLINASSDCYYSVDTRTGKLLWKIDFKNSQGLNITDAVVYNDQVFISSGYGHGGSLYRLKVQGDELIPEMIWHSDALDNHHGGVILHEGYLYGSGTNARGWFCLDLLNGEVQWKIAGKGSITYADRMLYLLDERGTMKLVEATPHSSDISGEFKVPEGGSGMFWAHPVICGGCLYIRHADKLYAYDVTAN
jgi:outer membrane protein assembly factor BamB